MSKRVFNSKDLYGDVPADVKDTRKSVCRFYLRSAKRQLEDLSKTHYLHRDDERVAAVLKAIKWNQKIIDEEI